ncbi:MAG: 6-pyruvoyl tetrahydropterin synthase family protein [Thermoplasmatales archaeon]|nr:6-pyruvoyl tetrahydropterin synthase family protein [Thermoplasmatales archaeon]
MKIQIDGWKSGLTFSSAHFLPDYSNCSRLHGHTYGISVVIEGEMTEGIIVDFRIVKEKIREIISKIDHKVIISTEGKLEIKKGEEIEIKYKNKRYVFPPEDCALLPIFSSSAENLATYILKEFLKSIELKNISKIEIGVDEGYGQGAWAKWEK